MSDDIWRRKDDSEGAERPEDAAGYGTDFGDDFGTVAFGGEPTDEQPAISFGASDTGPLPHWSEPPTGELPRFIDDAPSGETDVWSSYTSPGDDTTRSEVRTPEPAPEPSRPTHRDITSEGPLFNAAQRQTESSDRPFFFDDESSDDTFMIPVTGPTAERERIAIGSDPTAERLRRAAQTGPVQRPTRTRSESATGQVRRPGRSSQMGGIGDRDMPTAVTAGLLIAAVFLGALLWKPAAVVILIVLALGVASVEFFSKVSERGYRPASLLGTVACVCAPAAAYWLGAATLPLVMVLAFMAAAVGFVGSDGVQAGPMPNVAITTLGVVWIGLLGAYASLILRFSTADTGFANAGTDTLFIVAAGVVANDVAALFVGSSTGRTPLREWISPNKSVEGLVGGSVGTFLAVLIVGVQSDTWNSLGEWLALAVVISIAAPLGDLVESMFKRNLDVKDFGTAIAGHGGVLDRFDGFLFVLPAVYYLAAVMQPWAS